MPRRFLNRTFCGWCMEYIPGLLSEIDCISFDAIFGIYERERYAMEFCDAINIKGVKCGFRYFGNVKGTPSFELIMF